MDNVAEQVRSYLGWLAAIPMSVRIAAGALLALLGIYLVLAAADRWSRTPLERLSTMTVDEQMLDNYRRTMGRPASTADTLTAGTLYMRTLSTLRGARASTLGLFPRYNPDSLQHAEHGLEQVVRRTDEGSFLALEAHFYLGKVHLAQRDLQEARSYFEHVVQEEGRRQEDARRILRALMRMGDGDNAGR
ncbi:MAG: hypothetical protein BRD55_05360 [Bacteroidetes bacterium SW_9_63_38]|nr:MAG: hypothetical protein BRD55_05360 [Bacteroidetes bacterium SW_9_63_38]